MNFEQEVRARVEANQHNDPLLDAAKSFTSHSIRALYSYNFSWLGRPVIQYPQDMIALQELVWQAKPDLIIETGIAHGGSLILSASLLTLLDYCEAAATGVPVNPQNVRRRVLGLDIDIRPHNRAAIETHPMAHRIDMIEGNSVAPETIEQVHRYASDYKRVFICMDSNHTHEHVLAELEAYAPLTSGGSYCVVFDTIIEDLPESMYPDRPWDRGNNPKTAVREYLRRLKVEGRTAADGAPLHFEIESAIENKLLITAVPGGYLKRL
ncbi:MAG: cephalosporin hydroxylase family protein [Syntrophales bacterium]|nr:cephalosporin hydroxylase family protein [Syntrophales bacterium]